MDIGTLQNVVLGILGAWIAFMYITSKALDQIADEMDAENKKGIGQ